MAGSRGPGLGLAALFLLAGMAASAHAQKMYRCGNTYQDRPCMGEQPGKVIVQNSEGRQMLDEPGTATSIDKSSRAPSSSHWAAHTSMTSRIWARGSSGRVRSWRGEKQITRHTPLS